MTVRDSAAIYLQILSQPTVAAVGIEIDVYDAANYATMLDTLEGARQVSYQKQLNQAGAGSFKINRHDAKATGHNLQKGNLCKVKIDGVYRGAFFMEETVGDFADPAGAGAEDSEIKGRGVLAYMERAVVYPTGWPATKLPDVTYTGVTRGAILKDQIDQAKARGGLGAMTYDFTATVDSIGNPWTDTNTLTLHIGLNLFDLIRQMAALGTDFYMDTSLALHAYKSLSIDRTGASGAAAVVLRQGKHIGENALSVSEHNSAVRSRLLVEGSGNNIQEVVDSPVETDTSVGRREGYLSYTASGDTQALNDAGLALLQQLAMDAQPLTMTITHGLSAPLRPNLLSQNDASLETDISGWTPAGSDTIARSTAQALDGAASLALTSTGSGAAFADIVAGNIRPVNPGQQYTASAYFRAAATPNVNILVKLEWFQSPGVYSTITQESIGAAITDTTTGWTQAFSTALAPADAAFAGVELRIQFVSGAGEVHYADQISLMASGSAVPPTGEYEPFVDYDVGDYVLVDVPGAYDLAALRLVSITITQIEGGDFTVTVDLNSVYLEYLIRVGQKAGALSGGSSSSTSGPSGGGGSAPAAGAGRVAVAVGDAPGYLYDKISAGAGIIKTLTGSAPAETVTLAGFVLTALTEQTVGTAQATIAHGLAATPTTVILLPTTAGQVWQSAAPNATNIFLTADAAGRKVIPYVR